MKKIYIFIAIIVATVGILMGCSSVSRGINDLKSDFSGGLERTVKVYTADGKVLAEYKGKFDIADAEGGYVKFDFNGKRYIYYNCFVESIAELK